MMADPGIFICIEGPDGSGKSTVISKLQRERMFEDAIFIREPGGTAIGENIRTLLMSIEDIEDADTWTLVYLFAAARAQLCADVILPALSAGHTIIADRFVFSSMAYQGAARPGDPSPQQVLDVQWNMLSSIVDFPYHLIVLDVESEIGLSRAAVRKGASIQAFEDAPLAFHRIVREFYIHDVIQMVSSSEIIDTTRATPDEVFEMVKESIISACTCSFGAGFRATNLP